MKAVDAEKLQRLLEVLGAQVLTTDPKDEITISHAFATEIVAVLSSLREAKVGLPKQWTPGTRLRAIFRMLDGTSVPVLAREIAEETGQPRRSAERRLWALKNSPRFKIWKRVD